MGRRAMPVLQGNRGVEATVQRVRCQVVNTARGSGNSQGYQCKYTAHYRFGSLAVCTKHAGYMALKQLEVDRWAGVELPSWYGGPLSGGGSCPAKAGQARK
jgi:hypothetical protein